MTIEITAKKPTVVELITTQKAQIAAALPRHITADRFARIALTECRKNPELGSCDPMSFLGAVIQAAQLGLEPGSGLGQCYLIPFNNKKKGIKEVTLITGYRGLIDLARRSGNIESISARIVREKDSFSYSYGDDERITHVPSDEADAGRITHAYAVARLKGGSVQREVMTRAQLDLHKERFSKGNPVWESDFDEMCRKTVVRRLCKYLPLSPELVQAISTEDGGSQENWRLLDPQYEPPKQVLDVAKIRAHLNEGSDQLKNPVEQAVELQTARGVFKQAWDSAMGRGVDVVKALGGVNPNDLYESTLVNQLYTGADRLEAAR